MSDRPRWLTEAARSTVAGGGSGNQRRRGTGRAAPALTSSRSRFERRAAAVRRRPLRSVALLVAVLAVMGGAVWAVGFSPLLSARSVVVSGLSDPREQQAAAAAAAVPIGTPLVRVDTTATAQRVQAIPTVASVTVDRSWPSSVVVSVHRKVAVAAVKNPQGQLQVVDVTGVPFEAVTTLPPGVAQINAASEAPDPEGVRAAIGVLALLTPAQRASVSAVTVTSADLVTLQLGPVSVIWGGVSEGPKKLTVLQALLATNASVIDVSAPDTPVTR